MTSAAFDQPDEQASLEEATPLQEAMAYVSIARSMIQRDEEAGVLDDAELDNLAQRLATAEAIAMEQLANSSPMTHRDPLESLGAEVFQEAHYRLPFAAQDVAALPWDDLIARLRSVAHGGKPAARLAYHHVSTERLREIPEGDVALARGVREALDELRAQFAVSAADLERADHREAEEALATIAEMRADLEEIRLRRASESQEAP